MDQRGRGFLALAGLLLTACVSIPGPGTQEGALIDTFGRQGMGTRRPLPGDELTHVGLPIKNISEYPLRFVRVDLLRAKGLGSVARVVGIELVPEERPPISLGYYTIHPPVSYEGRSAGCVELRLVPVEGYLLQPGETVWLSIHMKIIAPGAFQILRERIVFTAGDQTHQHVAEFELRGQVRPRGRRIPVPNVDRCR